MTRKEWIGELFGYVIIAIFAFGWIGTLFRPIRARALGPIVGEASQNQGERILPA